MRGGLKTVLIPKDNEKDLVDIPDNVKAGLEIIPVGMVDEALSKALIREPLPLAITPGDEDVSTSISNKDDKASSDDIVAH